jgi:hypothetical protein
VRVKVERVRDVHTEGLIPDAPVHAVLVLQTMAMTMSMSVIAAMSMTRGRG